MTDKEREFTELYLYTSNKNNFGLVNEKQAKREKKIIIAWIVLLICAPILPYVFLFLIAALT